jgi:hypothetical protein
METLTPRQTVFALAVSIVAFLFIVELVRRRRLREEYSWLWLLTGGAMIVLVVWFQLLLGITALVGAVTPITTLLLFAVLFLFAIVVHYSVIISKLTTQVKNLAQELALVSSRMGDSLDGGPRRAPQAPRPSEAPRHSRGAPRSPD